MQKEEKAVAEVLNREQIEEEIRGLDQLMRKNDYIGIKIAMGRATREEYAEQIAESEAWAKRKNELLTLLYGNTEKAEEEQPEGTEEQTEGQTEEASEEQMEEPEEQSEEQTEGETSEEGTEQPMEEQPEETEEPAEV